MLRLLDFGPGSSFHRTIKTWLNCILGLVFVSGDGRVQISVGLGPQQIGSRLASGKVDILLLIMSKYLLHPAPKVFVWNLDTSFLPKGLWNSYTSFDIPMLGYTGVWDIKGLLMQSYHLRASRVWIESDSLVVMRLIDEVPHSSYFHLLLFRPGESRPNQACLG